MFSWLYNPFTRWPIPAALSPYVVGAVSDWLVHAGTPSSLAMTYALSLCSVIALLGGVAFAACAFTYETDKACPNCLPFPWQPFLPSSPPYILCLYGPVRIGSLLAKYLRTSSSLCDTYRTACNGPSHRSTTSSGGLRQRLGTTILLMTRTRCRRSSRRRGSGC